MAVINDDYKKLREMLDDIISKNKKKGFAEINPEQFSTKEIPCHAAFAHLQPGDPQYGYMHLYIEYEKEIYIITWRIHVPGTKHPSLSNRPQWMKQLVMHTEKELDFTYWTMEDTMFGSEAFMLDTPDKYLEAPDLYVKQVFRKTRHWCAANQMCRKLRKTDKKHIQIENERKARMA